MTVSNTLVIVCSSNTNVEIKLKISLKICVSSCIFKWLFENYVDQILTIFYCQSNPS